MMTQQEDESQKVCGFEALYMNFFFISLIIIVQSSCFGTYKQNK